MGYDTLLKKVRQAEQALEARERTVSADARQARATWKSLWTPGRIAAAGALAGFAFGWSRSRRASAGGTSMGFVRLASSLATLAGSLQARTAADEAEDAATATRVAAHDTREAAEAVDNAEAARRPGAAPTQAAANTPGNDEFVPPYEVPETFRGSGQL